MPTKRSTSAVAEAKPAPDKKRPTAAGLWQYYRVRWTFLTQICGSVPADPAIIKRWLASRQPAARPAGGKSIEEITEEVLDTIDNTLADEELALASMLCFQRHDGQVVVGARTIKGHIKDCARQISGMYVGMIQGEKSYAQRAINGVYLPPADYWIPVLRDGRPLAAADGTREKPIHVRTARGPMSSIKNFEFITQPTIEFTLQVVTKSFSLDDLQTLFEYGGVHGYGGERSDGEGRYTYDIDWIGNQTPPKSAHSGRPPDGE